MTVTSVRLRVLPAVLPINGRNVELQYDDLAGYVQWRLEGDEDWINLVPVTDITGPEGPAIELQSDGTNIQWRVVGDADWINLVSIVDITGPAPSLIMGDVSTLEADDTATAEFVSGGPGIYTLNLGLPMGADGSVPSRAWAIANFHPTTAPDSLRTAGYAAAGDGGGALYSNVVSEPSHAGKLSITLSDAVTVAWYEIAEPVIDVRMFGPALGGADDSTALQNALDLGRDVVVPRGVSIAYGGVIVDSQKISGGGTMVKLATADFGLIMTGTNPEVSALNFAPEATSGQPNADIKMADGCVSPRILNNSFDGETTTTYSAVVAAQDTTDDPTDYPYTDNVVDVRIQGNRFLGYTRPVFLLCVDRYEISDNYFTHSTFDAIRIRETIGEGIISRNHFFEVGDQTHPDNQTRDCIDTALCGQKLLISDNIMIRPAYLGIDIKGISTEDTGSSKNIIISGNYIEGAWKSAIGIACDELDAPDFLWSFLVANNIIIGFNQSNSGGAGGVGDAGISVDRQVRAISIIGNQIFGGYGRGISLPGATGTNTKSRHVIVSDNQVFNNLEIGVNIGNVSGAVITGNIVGNDTQAYTKAGHSGSIIPSGGGHTVGFQLNGLETDAKYATVFAHNIVRSVSSSPVAFSGTNALADALAKYSDNVFIDCPAIAGSLTRWALAGSRIFWGDGTAPASSSGTFLRGDIIFNATPSAAGKVGLVCVTGGNPGTWKAFGTIDA